MPAGHAREIMEGFEELEEEGGRSINKNKMKQLSKRATFITYLIAALGSVGSVLLGVGMIYSLDAVYNIGLALFLITLALVAGQKFWLK